MLWTKKYETQFIEDTTLNLIYSKCDRISRQIVREGVSLS